ncbi:MAG: MmgE/PrpD family protein [Rubrivivax sp.]
MSPTAELAAFACRLTHDDIPADVRDRATVAIIDALGTVYAGLDEVSVQHVRDYALGEAGAGAATLIGLGRQVSPAAAALCNAAAAHALDFDNISLTVSGFVASPALFALLAVAQTLDRAVRGQEVLQAFVAGWEVEAAMAAGLGVDHYARGWHSTATLGHFGAAVAAGRMLGLTPRQMQHAIGIAASEASGLRTMIGNMTNPFHVGKAARNGVTAAVLASRGFVAEPQVIEHSHGFAVAFNGKGNFDLEAMSRHVGRCWDLVDPGLVVKMYPCCGLIHSGIDAALALRAGGNGIPQLDPASIEDVTVQVHALVPPTMKFDRPATGYEAKFSTPFCIATAFQEGDVRLAHFTDERTRDPKLLALMSRIRTEVHPDLTQPDTFLQREFTQLRIRLRDGGERVQRVMRLDNRGSRGHPVDCRGIAAKFEQCLGRHPRRERVRSALPLLAELGSLDDVRVVLERLQ